jgi:SPP1 gp7 family putative phage head morphogenesis protein
LNINAQNDKEVEKLEKKLRAVYLRAQTETQAKMEDYLRRFATKDAIKQEQVKQGKITQEEYINWRKGQIAVGKLWQDKVNALAADYTNANRIAMGVVRGDMAGTFATNHNYAAYQLEHDTMLNLSFSLYDQNTLVNLVKNNPDMLPLPSVDIPKDLRWNKQKINAVIIQAVLQGDSIPKIAQSLRKVSDMNYKAAIRNARTSMTAAQNAGRVESYKHAQDMGINLEQEWLATLDGRTRHSHRQMDGERISVAKDKWHPAKFSNGCRYPGDPNGPPWEIYNCRCTLVAAIKGIDQSNAPRNSKLGGMSYEEWKNGHKAQPAQAAAPSVPVALLHLQSIRAVLGDDYVNAMETLLEFTEEPNVKDLYYKFGDRLDVVNDPDMKGGAFFRPSEGKVHMNAEYVSKGDNLHAPYQTAFHEFGHNIDWLAGRDAGGTYISVDYENGKLGKTIKSDWQQFKIKMFRDYPSEYLYGGTIEAQEKTFRMYVRYVDTGDGKYIALSHKLQNGEITMYEAMHDDKLMQRVMAQMKKDWVDPDDVTIALLKREGKDISECGSVSDIIEYCTRKSYPLGVGHDLKYWKGNPDAGAKEFFAETLDGMAANPKSLAQMRRIFPNSVGVVEEIVGGLVK